MFLINKAKKRLENIESATFKELGISERYDLQEWLEKSPSIFGEDLLIIQKEFDGFGETNERLDLLALDKQGNIVVIENKLDDSGRDVIWQVLKYAAYCSTLKSKEIKEIFEQYLNKQGSKESAVEIFEDFFDDEDYEEHINIGNTQRVIMVAGKFRKEVTSTVMWLMNYGLRVQCFKASVFKNGEQELFNLEQIIPLKDSEDYIIRMASKNLEELNNQQSVKKRKGKRVEFWAQFLLEMNKQSDIMSNVGPGYDDWIPVALGMSGVSINLVVTQKYARTEVYINRGDWDLNKDAFDYLYSHKEQIEQKFGGPLVWERKEDKVVSRVKVQIDNVSASNKEDWNKINKFLIETSVKMKNAMSDEIQKMRNELKK